jgi:type 1 glutamine amidotransferase
MVTMTTGAPAIGAEQNPGSVRRRGPATRRGLATRRALVALRGDDVYEDLFTAGVELQAILQEAGFLTEVRFGTARLEDRVVMDGLDLVVLFTAGGRGVGGQDDEAQGAVLRHAVSAGVGLVSIHSTNLGGPLDVIGTRFLDHGPEPHEGVFEVSFAPDHPVSAGVGAFAVAHEHYRVAIAPDTRTVAWRIAEDGRREPVVTARRIGRGGSVWIQLGHDMRVWAEPRLRQAVRNAADWTTNPEPHQPDGRS